MVFTRASYNAEQKMLLGPEKLPVGGKKVTSKSKKEEIQGAGVPSPAPPQPQPSGILTFPPARSIVNRMFCPNGTILTTFKVKVTVQDPERPGQKKEVFKHLFSVETHPRKFLGFSEQAPTGFELVHTGIDLPYSDTKTVGESRAFMWGAGDSSSGEEEED